MVKTSRMETSHSVFASIHANAVEKIKDLVSSLMRNSRKSIRLGSYSKIPKFLLKLQDKYVRDLIFLLSFYFWTIEIPKHIRSNLRNS